MTKNNSNSSSNKLAKRIFERFKIRGGCEKGLSKEETRKRAFFGKDWKNNYHYWNNQGEIKTRIMLEITNEATDLLMLRATKRNLQYLIVDTSDMNEQDRNNVYDQLKAIDKGYTNG